MCRSALPSVVADELLCDNDPDVRLCQGMRRCSTRSFVLPSLPILGFHVHAFFVNGILKSFEDIPSTLAVQGFKLRLVAVTLFCAAVCDRVSQWYLYDGLHDAQSRIHPIAALSNRNVNHVLFINENVSF